MRTPRGGSINRMAWLILGSLLLTSGVCAAEDYEWNPIQQEWQHSHKGGSEQKWNSYEQKWELAPAEKARPGRIGGYGAGRISGDDEDGAGRIKKGIWLE